MQTPKPPTIDAVCERALRLPCSPALLPKLALALQKEDSSAEEIESIIVCDPSLAAATLRLANSAALGGGVQVESVSQALVRLGQKEVYRLASLALVNRWSETNPGNADRREPGDFSRHALCMAIAAEVLAEMTQRYDPQAAYTAGLVTDLGKLALAHACGEFLPAIRARCGQANSTWEDAELTVLGYHNSQVSARLLRSWKFPNAVVAAAEFCLTPKKAPAESHVLVAHLHAARYLATAIGVGVAEDGFLFELDNVFLEESGFTPALIDEAMPMVLERAYMRLQEKLTCGVLKF